MKPADFSVARSLADNLMTTGEPSKYWDEISALTQVQYLALDTITFECQTCNHWWPVADRKERNGQFYCYDCV